MLKTEAELKEIDRKQAELYQEALAIMTARGCKECPERANCNHIYSCPKGKPPMVAEPSI